MRAAESDGDQGAPFLGYCPHRPECDGGREENTVRKANDKAKGKHQRKMRTCHGVHDVESQGGGGAGEDRAGKDPFGADVRRQPSA